jgi:uncharacterized damage-inducible protein DinB
MSEIRRIKSQLRRAYEGPAWHGPSLKELLSDVTAEKAARRPLGLAHSIWELVNHIGAWERIVRLRITSPPAVEPSDEENFPPVNDTSEAAWAETLVRLEEGNRALRDTIAELDEARLADMVPGTEYNVYFMLHGVIQHDLYHAGQIALLKKA